MMRKITLASALCLGQILAACGGGGGSDGGAASSGNSANVANGGKNTSGSAAGSSSSGSGATGGGGASQSGSASSGSGNPSGSGTSTPGGSGSTGSTDGTGSGGTGTGGSGSSGSGGAGSGSGDSGSSGGASAGTGNTIPVLVSSASTVRNYPLVSVTICKPNSNAQTSCATINNVLLDTGSFGLRLFASAIPPATLATLPIRTDASSNKNVATCAQFGSGYMWGSLRNADVKLGGEIAPTVPVQVVSDPAIVSSAPSSCVWNTSLNSPSALGANGVLGVGVARYDCGTNCATTARAGYYYADANPAIAIAMPLANQVTNPVALFPVDNNGVIVSMPTVPGQLGAVAAAGTVIFGIDTQSNNLLAGSGATVFNTDLYGNFTGSYNGASTVTTFVDSGSNALNFQDGTIPQTSAFYTPATELTRAVALSSSNGSAATVNIDIGNAATLFASINYAFSNLGAYLAQTIDLGFPFFYGRRVYYGIVGSTSNGGGTGPYVAFGAN